MVRQQPNLSVRFSRTATRKQVEIKADELLRRLPGASGVEIDMTVLILAVNPRPGMNMNLESHPFIGDEGKTISVGREKGFRICDALRVQTIRRGPSVLKLSVDPVAKVASYLEWNDLPAVMIHLRKTAKVTILHHDIIGGATARAGHGI